MNSSRIDVSIEHKNLPVEVQDDKAHPNTCPSCGWVGMEKKINKAEGESRTCLKCGHKMVVAEPEEVVLA